MSYDYRVVNNDRVTEQFWLPFDNSEWSSHPKELVRNVHNDRDPGRLQDAWPELSDMCYQLKTMSLVTLSLLTTLNDQ